MRESLLSHAVSFGQTNHEVRGGKPQMFFSRKNLAGDLRF